MPLVRKLQRGPLAEPQWCARIQIVEQLAGFPGPQAWAHLAFTHTCAESRSEDATLTGATWALTSCINRLCSRGQKAALNALEYSF
jgi:hypothetical protein